MEIEVVLPDGYVPDTDTPRALTLGEAADIIQAGRLNGIKLHRRMTRSTLRAAVREVDAVLAMTPRED